MICLVKSAANFEYLKQNLTILCSQPGVVLETSYRERWVTSAIIERLPKAGERICIVFSDPPFSYYVPVRFARVCQDVMLQEDGKIPFQYKLGKYVDAGGLQEFSLKMKTRCESQYFVVDISDDSLQETQSDDSTAWRSTIDHLIGSASEAVTGEHAFLDRYLSTFFFRQVGLADNKKNALVECCEIGREYSLILECYSPHLSVEKISACHIVGTSTPPIMDTREVLGIADGRVSIHLTPRFSGQATIALWLYPDQNRSTQLDIKLCVYHPDKNLEEEQGIESAYQDQVASVHRIAEGRSTIDSYGSYIRESQLVSGMGLTHAQCSTLYNRLLNTIEEKSGKQPDLRLDLINQLIEFAADATARQFLVEEKIRHLYAQGGQETTIIRLLSDLAIERLQSDVLAIYFISKWHQQDFGENVSILIDRYKGNMFPDLDKAIRQAMPWRKILKMPKTVENLVMGNLWDASCALESLMDVEYGTEIVNLISYLVEDVGLVTKNDAYEFLNDWLGRSGTTIYREKVAEKAIEYGLALGKNVSPIVILEGSNIALSEKPLLIKQWLTLAEKGMNYQDRIDFYEAILTTYCGKDTKEQVEILLEINLKLADYYLHCGSPSISALENAGKRLESARSSLGAFPSYKAYFKRLEDELEQEFAGNNVIRRYLNNIDEIKRAKLAQILQEKKVIFVGGETKSFDAMEVAKTLGFAEGEHIEVYKEKGKDLGDLVKRVKKGYVDYVIDIIHFTRHHNELKEACETARRKGINIHYLIGPKSYLCEAFLQVLLDYHKDDIEKLVTEDQN